MNSKQLKWMWGLSTAGPTFTQVKSRVMMQTLGGKHQNLVRRTIHGSTAWRFAGIMAVIASASSRPVIYDQLLAKEVRKNAR